METSYEQLASSVSGRERRAIIMKMLESEEEVLVTTLSRMLHTSEVTIRKDLTSLQERNLIIRTRGGAIRRPIENLGEDTSVGKKSTFNFREKDRIGEAASKLIKNGDHIILDSGTTTLAMARHLDHLQNLTIITNSIDIANELLRYQRFSIIILGGHLRVNSHSVVGPLASATLRNFSDYKFFMGVDSFSIENGVSTPNLEEALLNQQMLMNASQVIAVFDASKCNKRSYTHVCATNQLNVIVTDDGMPTEIRTRLKEMNIKVIIA